jgi:hypothetical protein
MIHSGLRWALHLACTVWLVGGIPVSALSAEERDTYILPPGPIQELLSRDKNFTTLDRMSPDGDHFLIPHQVELSTLPRLAARTLRLAMFEVSPETNRDRRHSTYGVDGLSIYSLKGRTKKSVSLPADVLLSDFTWSRDGKRLGFLAHLPAGTQVWTVNAETALAHPLSEAPVMATLASNPERADDSASRMLQWTADGSILTLLVPEDRGQEPESRLPEGPTIRRTRDKKAPTSTQRFLLHSRRDEDLFRYYMTSQLALLREGQPPRKIGSPALYEELRLSPDEKYLLVEKVVEPFSELVGYEAFARETQIMDLGGNLLATVRKTPLREELDRERRWEQELPREMAWRPDGKGLSYLLKEEKPKGEATAEDAPRKDRLMFLSAPFDPTAARPLATREGSFSKPSYSGDSGYAFLTVTENAPGNSKKKRQSLLALDLSASPARETVILRDVDPDDVVRLPGEIMTRSTGNGIAYALLSSDRRSLFLKGGGYQPSFKPQPFVDRIAIAGGERTRLFEGSPDRFETPLVPLDGDLQRLVVGRESPTLFPDSYLWSAGDWENLTHNPDPFPEITACRRVDFEFTRRDGTVVLGGWAATRG